MIFVCNEQERLFRKIRNNGNFPIQKSIVVELSTTFFVRGLTKKFRHAKVNAYDKGQERKNSEAEM